MQRCRIDAAMRGKAFTRHQTSRHMWRRLKEDRNQHYTDLSCPCWTDPKAMALFKEQLQRCRGKLCCTNPRRIGKSSERLTIQERRFEGSLRPKLKWEQPGSADD